MDSDETFTITDKEDAAWASGQRVIVEDYLQAQKEPGSSLKLRTRRVNAAA